MKFNKVSPPTERGRFRGIRWRIGKFDRMTEVITRLFSYRPNIKPSIDNYPWLCIRQLSTFGLDIWADVKTAV